MELREKIARTICSTVSYEMDTCEYIADAILDIPEIREALEAKVRVVELEQEADSLWHEMKYPRD